MNGFFDYDFWPWDASRQMWGAIHDCLSTPVLFDSGGGRPEPVTTYWDNGKAFCLVMSVADDRSPDERADAERINQCVSQSIYWSLRQSRGYSLETARRIRNEIHGKLERLQRQGVLPRSLFPFSGGCSYCAAYGTEKYTVLLGEGDCVFLWKERDRAFHTRPVAGDPEYFAVGRSQFELVLLMCGGTQQSASILSQNIGAALQNLRAPDGQEEYLRDELGEMGKQNRRKDGSHIAYLYLPTAGRKNVESQSSASAATRVAAGGKVGNASKRPDTGAPGNASKRSDTGTPGNASKRLDTGTPGNTSKQPVVGKAGSKPQQTSGGKPGKPSARQTRAAQKKIDSLRQQWSENDQKYQACLAQLTQMQRSRQSAAKKRDRRQQEFKQSVSNIRSKCDSAPPSAPQADRTEEKSMNYAVFDAHTLGRSHKKKNICCEDYSAHYCDPEGRFAIAVVCDGHSDPTCFRSADGARFGCEAVVETLSRFLPACLDDPQSSLNEDDLNRLKAAIMQTWSWKVQTHLSENPITEEDLAPLEGRYRAAQEKYRRKQRLQRIYGATLLGAAVCEGFYLVMQIGDGTMYRLEGGGYYSIPLPEDPRAKVTPAPSSLCDSDVLTREGAFRLELIQGQPQAIYMMTDGIGDWDSVSLRDFLCNVQNKLSSMMGQPAEQVGVRELNEDQSRFFQSIVDSCAERITDDDCSLGGFYRYDLPVEPLHLTQEEVDALVAELERVQRADEQGYMENLQRVDNVIQKLNREKDSLEEERRRLERKMEELTGQQNALLAQQDANRAQLDKYQQNKDAAIQNHQKRVQEIEAQKKKCQGYGPQQETPSEGKGPDPQQDKG